MLKVKVTKNTILTTISWLKKRKQVVTLTVRIIRIIQTIRKSERIRKRALCLFKMMRMCLHRYMGKVMVILIELTCSCVITFSMRAGKTKVKVHPLKNNTIIIRRTSKKMKRLMKKMIEETLKWMFMNISTTSGLRRRIARIWLHIREKSRLILSEDLMNKGKPKGKQSLKEKS